MENDIYEELGDNMFVISRFSATRQRSGKTGICDRKMIQFMPAKHSNTNRGITSLIFILIKSIFKTFSLCCNVALLRTWRRHCFHGINAMILMIFDVITNDNARYKRNEQNRESTKGYSKSIVR